MANEGGGAEKVSEAHERARKIKPQLAEGSLVKVVGARNQAEAEFIQGMLLEEGVPSLLRRSAGFDVPDFLAAGPRDVLVPQSGVSTARQVLLEAELIDDGPREATVAPLKLLAGLLIALAIGALIVWLFADAHPLARSRQPRQVVAPRALGLFQRAPRESFGQRRAGSVGVEVAGELGRGAFSLVVRQEVDHGASQQGASRRLGGKRGRPPSRRRRAIAARA